VRQPVRERAAASGPLFRSRVGQVIRQRAATAADVVAMTCELTLEVGREHRAERRKRELCGLRHAGLGLGGATVPVKAVTISFPFYTMKITRRCELWGRSSN
jgi:hypothetical protein